MSAISADPAYALDCDEEPLRLERQARLYGVEDDLARLAPRAADRVLDAGCGAGSLTRAIARRVPQGATVGLDREPRYLDYALRQAATEELGNVRFEVGDATRLPFADGSFDLVWSKHLLQWVPDREGALGEFVRVVRPGGRIVCCNFDGFCLSHHPTDVRIQADLERWFAAAREQLGFDNSFSRVNKSGGQACATFAWRSRSTRPSRASAATRSGSGTGRSSSGACCPSASGCSEVRRRRPSSPTGC